MQAQQQLRFNAAPRTVAVVFFAALAFGAIGGYAIGRAVPPLAVPAITHVAPALPATQAPLRASPPFEEGMMCTRDLTLCREPQNSYD
jgi:hypothetical protein